MAVRLADGSDRVGVVENERLVWRCGDANLGARPSGDGFVEPDLLDDGRVFYQAEERGPGRHQRSACLLLGQPVQAMVEIAAVLVEERLELGACWLADDVLGRRAGEEGHVCSIAGASQFSADWPSGVSENKSSASSSAQLRLRLGDPAAAAYADLAARLGPRVLVCQTVPAATELSEPELGPLVVVGAGGVLVELPADRAAALPPVSAKLAADMVAGLRVSKLLARVRGSRPADLAAVARAIAGGPSWPSGSASTPRRSTSTRLSPGPTAP